MKNKAIKDACIVATVDRVEQRIEQRRAFIASRVNYLLSTLPDGTCIEVGPNRIWTGETVSVWYSKKGSAAMQLSTRAAVIHTKSTRGGRYTVLRVADLFFNGQEPADCFSAVTAQSCPLCYEWASVDRLVKVAEGLPAALIQYARDRASEARKIGSVVAAYQAAA